MNKNEVLNTIKNQKGSNGDSGWPVVVRDRISFPKFDELRVTEANVAVTFLWTIRDEILPKLEKENLAIATNFYTPAGLQGMIRNILGNPFIRYVILLGEEYSSRKEGAAGHTGVELTSANAIRTFFEKGVNEKRGLDGFENAVYIDKNIPLELINKIKTNVKLIDLNREMIGSNLDQKIERANYLIKTLESKEPFEEPQTFEFEKTNMGFPYEGGPIITHGTNIPDAWIKTIYNINRYGRPNLMNAQTDRWVKEINNMTVVIHDPQNIDLSFNPFLVPMTLEKIEAYKREILSPILPEGKAYTYGNKIRAYYYPGVNEMNELINSNKYKDFEFGRGPWIDANVEYLERHCEIDQLQDMIDCLKRDPYSKAVLAITWHPADELMRKHKSSPCMITLQAIIQDEKLNLFVFFRSHDMTQGWPENAYGCAAIQKEISEGVGVEPGLLTITSGSAQIYNNYYQQVEAMLEKYKNKMNNCSDRRGNYQISVQKDLINVKLLHPESGQLLEEYSGKTAYDLKEKIAKSSYQLETAHAIYLGTELVIAQDALDNNKEYEQDSILKK